MMALLSGDDRRGLGRTAAELVLLQQPSRRAHPLGGGGEALAPDQ